MNEQERPANPDAALALGYKEIGLIDDVKSRLLEGKNHELAEKAFIGSGCNPPPQDNVCFDGTIGGKHLIGYCVPGRGCVVYEAP